MRKIKVISMISLDSVLQAPGGKGEDDENGFEYGGWTANYGDEESMELMMKDLAPTDYLLGRKTFEIWENYWPLHKDFWPGISAGNKYVFSNSRNETEWENTTFINDVDEIKKLKEGDGPDIQVWGSSHLIQLLLENDLVDKLSLKIYPVTLGQGKKLFGDGTMAAGFKLENSHVTSKGVIFADYLRDGEITRGDIKV